MMHIFDSQHQVHTVSASIVYDMILTSAEAQDKNQPDPSRKKMHYLHRRSKAMAPLKRLTSLHRSYTY
jgi:hypothetical protein